MIAIYLRAEYNRSECIEHCYPKDLYYTVVWRSFPDVLMHVCMCMFLFYRCFISPAFSVISACGARFGVIFIDTMIINVLNMASSSH
jgi:hypothetical protein